MKVVSPPGTPPRRPAGIAAGGEKWSVPFGKPLETMGRKATELRCLLSEKGQTKH